MQYLLGFVYGDIGRHERLEPPPKRAIHSTRRSAPRRPTSAAGEAAGRPGSARPPRGAPARSRRRPAGPLHLGPPSGGAGTGRGLREYRLALERGEDGRGAIEGMAEISLLRRETPTALELYERLLEAARHAKLWTERGVVLHQAGRRDEARAAYQRALEANPG